MSSVTIRNVSKSFGDHVVLHDFSASFRDGEFITLLGPSGCGKTTMLRMIAGFEKPDAGEIFLDDRLLSGGTAFVPPEKRGIGMVFQSYAVWPHMTVFENVAYPLHIRHSRKDAVREQVERALKMVHLGDYAARYPNELSGGQQQRVALARALVAEPSLLLLDEPLSNLDAKLRESMRFEIKEIQQRLGITVVYVTHDRTEAMTMSDRIFLIHRGAIQQAGSPEDLYIRPANPFVADFLGKVDFFPAVAGEGRLSFPEMNGQSISYDGTQTGKLVVAIRPENLSFSENGELRGTLESVTFLGDVVDCRVRVGDIPVRLLTAGYKRQGLRTGEQVRLKVRDYLVFDDDGSLDELLAIRT